MLRQLLMSEAGSLLKSRRRCLFSGAGGLSAGLAFYLVLGAAPAFAESPPNIIFFLVDDLGWVDHSVSAAYGPSMGNASPYYETPGLETLAEQGMSFTHAYAKIKPFALGTTDAQMDALVGTYKHITDAITDAAEDYIDKRVAANEPFFMNLCHYAVHAPTDLARPDLLAKYNAKPISTNPWHRHAGYAALMEGADQSLQRVIARLRDPNGDGDPSDDISGNTLVIYYSDNGGSLTEAPTDNSPLRGGKQDHWEGGLRVPMVAWWPGTIGEAASNDTLVHITDYDGGRLELYNLSDDIGETKNLLAAGGQDITVTSPAAADLSAELSQWVASETAPLPTLPNAASGADTGVPVSLPEVLPEPPTDEGANIEIDAISGKPTVFLSAATKYQFVLETSSDLEDWAEWMRGTTVVPGTMAFPDGDVLEASKFYRFSNLDMDGPEEVLLADFEGSAVDLSGATAIINGTPQAVALPGEHLTDAGNLDAGTSGGTWSGLSITGSPASSTTIQRALAVGNAGGRLVGNYLTGANYYAGNATYADFDFLANATLSLTQAVILEGATFSFDARMLANVNNTSAATRDIGLSIEGLSSTGEVVFMISVGNNAASNVYASRGTIAAHDGSLSPLLLWPRDGVWGNSGSKAPDRHVSLDLGADSFTLSTLSSSGGPLTSLPLAYLNAADADLAALRFTWDGKGGNWALDNIRLEAAPAP